MKATLLTRDDHWCQSAAEIARTSLDALVLTGNWGEPLPDIVGHERGDVLLSFLAPWVVPAAVLSCYKLAINFHPGDRNYPGIGCYNFALYEGAKRYGAVAHHMTIPVDSGPIVLERTFRVAPTESVASLRNRTLAVMLGMFSDIAERLPDIPAGEALWTRPAFTRKQLDELGRLRRDMDGAEIARRTRAMHFPGKPGAAFVG